MSSTCNEPTAGKGRHFRPTFHYRRMGHGVNRLGSRGNMDVSRMFDSPQYNMTTRSKPTPAPPCGTAPYLKASMYDCMLSRGISCA